LGWTHTRRGSFAHGQLDQRRIELQFAADDAPGDDRRQQGQLPLGRIIELRQWTRGGVANGIEPLHSFVEFFFRRVTAFGQPGGIPFFARLAFDFLEFEDRGTWRCSGFGIRVVRRCVTD
jgi:hypothetical protein